MSNVTAKIVAIFCIIFYESLQVNNVSHVVPCWYSTCQLTLIVLYICGNGGGGRLFTHVLLIILYIRFANSFETKFIGQITVAIRVR